MRAEVRICLRKHRKAGLARPPPTGSMNCRGFPLGTRCARNPLCRPPRSATLRTVRSVTTAELPKLLAQGVTYLDLRTPEEYQAGRIPGAFNLPVSLGSLSGLTPNPDFTEVALANFSTSETLIVGCHSGPRARIGAARLAAVGFSELIVDEQGWDGSRDAFGRLTPGWSRHERARESGAATERSYSRLVDNLSRLAR